MRMDEVRNEGIPKGQLVFHRLKQSSQVEADNSILPGREQHLDVEALGKPCKKLIKPLCAKVKRENAADLQNVIEGYPPQHLPR